MSTPLFTKVPPITIEARQALARHSLPLQQLLYSLGVEDAATAETFLNPNYETHLHSPLLLHDIVKATNRIHTAITNNERIVIFSDYDCDGIPGAVVLHDFFKAIGYTNFTNYIPHRHYEGFGLSVGAVEKMKADAAAVIITIDCGTTSHAAILRAQELGVEVIVTDHHEPEAELPPALAIVNPKLGNYPFPDLCGAGVVFKLVQALLQTGTYAINPGQEKWWLDMVGVATIADMVPLRGENRVLAHYGLQVLRKSRRPGLQQLLRKAKLNQSTLTEEDIGFTIAPRINAASRMDAPEHAFLMLTATDESEAGAHVDKLEKLNTERKSTVAVMTKEINHRLREMIEIPPVLVMGNPLWRPALVGLAANKLSEEYNRPVFLWGRDGNEVIKGSCRSGGGVSVVKLMEVISHAFHEHGGHHMSGGFSVHDDFIFSLPELLNNAHAELGSEAVVPVERIVTAELPLSAVFGEVKTALTQLAPFGVGNPKPLFAFNNVAPRKVEVFGKAKEHLKLVFETDAGQLEAVAFFAQPKDFQKEPAPETDITLLAHIETSFFMGRSQTRLRIVDII
jgi:single-stranded-DNA-specific exonuclease